MILEFQISFTFLVKVSFNFKEFTEERFLAKQKFVLSKISDEVMDEIVVEDITMLRIIQLEENGLASHHNCSQALF